jgi:hypothetical protein
VAQIETAIVLCAGSGSRMMPFTNFYPKSLLPIKDNLALELVLVEAVKSGVGFGLGYLPTIKSSLGLKIPAGRTFPGGSVEYNFEIATLDELPPLPVVRAYGEKVVSDEIDDEGSGCKVIEMVELQTKLERNIYYEGSGESGYYVRDRLRVQIPEVVDYDISVTLYSNVEFALVSM